MGSFEIIDLPAQQRVMEVNYWGAVRMMKGLLPSLRNFVRTREDVSIKPRIINVTSVCGRINLPGVSPYTASKFALEGMSESIRIETDPFDIKMVLIEPFTATTNMLTSTKQYERLDEFYEKSDKEVQKCYG
jgi:NAD(P)-dependent dehydrogenase (short-subunit alcohol dehydrogenase family)